MRGVIEGSTDENIPVGHHQVSPMSVAVNGPIFSTTSATAAALDDKSLAKNCVRSISVTAVRSAASNPWTGCPEPRAGDTSFGVKVRFFLSSKIPVEMGRMDMGCCACGHLTTAVTGAWVRQQVVRAERTGRRATRIMTAVVVGTCDACVRVDRQWETQSPVVIRVPCVSRSAGTTDARAVVCCAVSVDDQRAGRER